MLHTKQLNAEASNFHNGSLAAISSGLLKLHGPQSDSQWPENSAGCTHVGTGVEREEACGPGEHVGIAGWWCGFVGLGYSEPHAFCPSGPPPPLRTLLEEKTGRPEHH